MYTVRLIIQCLEPSDTGLRVGLQPMTTDTLLIIMIKYAITEVRVTTSLLITSKIWRCSSSHLGLGVPVSHSHSTALKVFPKFNVILACNYTVTSGSYRLAFCVNNISLFSL